LALELGDGDLLLMEAPSQAHWQHGLPSRRKIAAERINLTFRRIRT
jgi:alkylated DNA repair dioxygenase AlkB